MVWCGCFLEDAIAYARAGAYRLRDSSTCRLNTSALAGWIALEQVQSFSLLAPANLVPTTATAATAAIATTTTIVTTVIFAASAGSAGSVPVIGWREQLGQIN